MKKSFKWIVMSAGICACSLYGGVSWIEADRSHETSTATAVDSGCLRTPASSSEVEGVSRFGCTDESLIAHPEGSHSIPRAVIPALASQQPDYQMSRDEHVLAAEQIEESKDPDLALQTLVLVKMCGGYDGQKKVEVRCDLITAQRHPALQVLQKASDAGDKNATIDLARALLFDGTASSRAKAMVLLARVKQDDPKAQQLYSRLAEE